MKEIATTAREHTREKSREIWMRNLGHIDITKREMAENRNEEEPAIREADDVCVMMVLDIGWGEDNILTVCEK